MIALLLAATVAQADPAVLRTTPLGFGAFGGVRGVSVGGWITEHAGVAVTVPWNAGTVGLSAGGRWDLVRGPKGWGVTAVVSGGPVFSTATPGLGLELAPAIVGGLVGERFTGSAGLALPVAIGWFDTFQARVPLMLETQIGGRIGPVWITASLRLGASFNPGVDTSILLDPGVAIVWDGALHRPADGP